MSQQKRKHVVITIQQKLHILDLLDKGTSTKEITKAYNIGNSTVHDIKKNKDKLRKFSVSIADSIYGHRHRKTMLKSPYELLNRAVLQWFHEERSANRPVSGPQLIASARQLFITLDLPGKFDGTQGWLNRFKDRYGIRTIGDSMDFVWDKNDPQRDQPSESDCSNPKTVPNDSLSKGDMIRSELEENYICLKNDSNGLFEEKMPDEGISSDLKTLDKQNTIDSEQEDFMGFETLLGTDEEEIPKDNCNDLQEDVVEYNHQDFKKLAAIVKNLQLLSDKLTESTKGDSFDNFGKYIASLLRRLPKDKVLSLKQKIVADILDEILTHERGNLIPNSSMGLISDNNKEKEQTPISKRNAVSSDNEIAQNSVTYGDCEASLSNNFQPQSFLQSNITNDIPQNQIGPTHIKSLGTIHSLKQNKLVKEDDLRKIVPSTTTNDSIRNISSAAVNTPIRNEVLLSSLRSKVQQRVLHTKTGKQTNYVSKRSSPRVKKRKMTRSLPQKQDPCTRKCEGGEDEPVTLANARVEPDGAYIPSSGLSSVREIEFDIEIEDGEELRRFKQDDDMFETVMCGSSEQIKQEPPEVVDEFGSHFSDPEEFICDICSASFRTSNLLVNHFHNLHPGCSEQ